MAARELELDPIEIRRRNLVALNEMPYPLAKWCRTTGSA